MEIESIKIYDFNEVKVLCYYEEEEASYIMEDYGLGSETYCTDPGGNYVMITDVQIFGVSIAKDLEDDDKSEIEEYFEAMEYVVIWKID